MHTPIITDEAQYEARLIDLGKLIDMDPLTNSMEGQELVLLAKALEKYENIHYVIE